LENAEVNFTVKGSGTIAGVGNGDPQSMQPFQSDRISLFYGKAMLIIQSGEQPGNIIVTAASGKWQPVEIRIQAD
jgi:beta-galactosidase